MMICRLGRRGRRNVFHVAARCADQGVVQAAAQIYCLEARCHAHESANFSGVFTATDVEHRLLGQFRPRDIVDATERQHIRQRFVAMQPIDKYVRRRREWHQPKRTPAVDALPDAVSLESVGGHKTRQMEPMSTWQLYHGVVVRQSDFAAHSAAAAATAWRSGHRQQTDHAAGVNVVVVRLLFCFIIESIHRFFFSLLLVYVCMWMDYFFLM